MGAIDTSDGIPQTAPAHATTRPDRLGLYLLLAVVAAQLVPVWAFTYFPSMDGPAHVANNPAAEGWHAYYKLAKRPDPNLAGHLLLAGLMTVAPPLIAEKILLSLYIVGLPLAFAYALRAIRPGAASAAILITPFTYSYVLHTGFYNFCLSLVVLLVVLGYWMRHRERMTIGRMAAFAGLMLLLYMTHLLSLILAVVVIAVTSIWLVQWDLIDQWKRHVHDPAEMWRGFKSRALRVAAASMPAVLLAVWWIRRHPERKIPGDKKQLLIDLAVLEPLVSWGGAPLLLGIDSQSWALHLTLEHLPTLLLSLGLLAAGTYVLVRKFKQRRLEWHDGLLLATAAVAGLYLFVGVQVYLNQRLGLVAPMLFALWVAAGHMSRWVQLATQLGAAVVVLAMLAFHLQHSVPINRDLAEFASIAPHIEPDSTFLPLVAYRKLGQNEIQATGGIQSFLYAGGYLVPERRLVDLRNYEGHMGYFPVDYRDQVSPYRLLPAKGDDGRRDWVDLERWPPQIDWANYLSHIDYVYVWARDADLQTSQMRQFMGRLQRDFEFVKATESGRGQLFRRR